MNISAKYSVTSASIRSRSSGPMNNLYFPFDHFTGTGQLKARIVDPATLFNGLTIVLANSAHIPSMDIHIHEGYEEQQAKVDFSHSEMISGNLWNLMMCVVQGFSAGFSHEHVPNR